MHLPLPGVWNAAVVGHELVRDPFPNARLSPAGKAHIYPALVTQMRG